MCNKGPFPNDDSPTLGAMGCFGLEVHPLGTGRAEDLTDEQVG